MGIRVLISQRLDLVAATVEFFDCRGCSTDKNRKLMIEYMYEISEAVNNFEKLPEHHVKIREDDPQEIFNRYAVFIFGFVLSFVGSFF